MGRDPGEAALLAHGRERGFILRHLWMQPGLCRLSRPPIAAPVRIGYHYWANPDFRFSAELTEGLTRVTGRDAFKGGHLSLSRNPSRLLGIILGALALGEQGRATLAWCQSVLVEMKKRAEITFDPLVSYLLFRALGENVPVASLSGGGVYQLSFIDWVIRHQMHDTGLSFDQLRKIRESLLFESATDLRFESAPQAAFIWTGINNALIAALGEVTIQPRHVALVLENFEAALRRWRWDNDTQKLIRWPIVQERDVQDILWAILRSYFPHVVDEDALPKFGHSGYKADFGIPSLKLIVEVKYASGKDDFKKIEKEVQEDCVPYLRGLRYEFLIVFIYDDSASVQSTTRRGVP